MTALRDLEPHDLLLAAVVRQAIADLRTGPRKEREEARAYLSHLGLFDDAGEVVRPEVADVTLVWPVVERTAVPIPAATVEVSARGPGFGCGESVSAPVP
jgi:hypothetical protein